MRNWKVTIRKLRSQSERGAIHARQSRSYSGVDPVQSALFDRPANFAMRVISVTLAMPPKLLLGPAHQ